MNLKPLRHEKNLHNPNFAPYILYHFVHFVVKQIVALQV